MANSTESSPHVASGNSSFIIFSLNQNIQISQFPYPLPDPLDAYHPYYDVLADGSLLTPIFKADLISSNSRLFGIGVLLTLGAVNVWTCVGYIRRGKVKDKTLFWLLLASQLLFPTCFAALLAPFFLDNVDCTLVNQIAVITTELSYAILITGIISLKAYRCLSCSRFILFVVWILQIAIFALFAMDVRTINSPRRISGSCSTDGTLRYIPIALMLKIGETFFLALCFLYAVSRLTLYPAAQGRLSIAFSEKSPSVADQGEDGRRGWWDYVPRAPTPASPGQGSTHGRHIRGQSGQNQGDGRSFDDSLVNRLRNSAKGLNGGVDFVHHFNAQTSNEYAWKPSISTEQQAPRQLQLQRQSVQRQQMEKQPSAGVGRISTSTNGPRLSDGKQVSGGKASPEAPPSACTTSLKSISFAPSASNRSSRIDPLQSIPVQPTDNDLDGPAYLGSPISVNTKGIPAILQVRAVIKEEMICTTIIMLSCILSTAFTFRRAKQHDIAFGLSILLGANWAAISLLVMRSFSQVVRRHEREAILQTPPSFGGPLGTNAAHTAMERRRRNAFALAATQPSLLTSSFSLLDASDSKGTQNRNLIVGEGNTPSLLEHNPSLRRREGLRAWDEEKERRRQESQSEQDHADQYTQDQPTHVHRGIDPNYRPSDPFSDFRGFAGFEHDMDGEDSDIGRRKSGGSEQGTEELMLEVESIQRSDMLQQPMIATPRGENSFTWTVNAFALNPILSQESMLMPRRGPISPFSGNEPLLPTLNPKGDGTGEQQRFLLPFVGDINRAGPMVPSRPPPFGSPPLSPPRVNGGGRRGAVTDVPGMIAHLAPNDNGGVEVHVRLPTSMDVLSPLPSQRPKNSAVDAIL